MGHVASYKCPEGFKFTVWSSLYMDWGLTIAFRGEELFSSPVALGNESYGSSPADHFDSWDEAEAAALEGDDAFVPWGRKEWVETLKSEKDTLLEAFVPEDKLAEVEAKIKEREALYDRYIEQRYFNTFFGEFGVASLKPVAAVDAARSRMKFAQEREEFLGDWVPGDAAYDHREGPHGGYRLPCALPKAIAAEAKALGWEAQDFEPDEKLEMVVLIHVGEYFEPLDEQIRGMGFEVAPFRKHDWDSAPWGKPEHHSVKVDLSCPRGRSNYVWLTYDDKLWDNEALAGMSTGPRQLFDHLRRKRFAVRAGEWATKHLREEVQNYHVEVQFLWRGKVVGQSGLGGIEMAEIHEQAADAVWDNSLIEEAWRKAQDWVADALDSIKRRQAQLVEEVCLLPKAAQIAERNKRANKDSSDA